MGLVIGFYFRGDERHPAAGHTYEPGTFYEKNPAALALELSGKNAVPGIAIELLLGPGHSRQNNNRNELELNDSRTFSGFFCPNMTAN
ncbi:MAG: hypothetical protein PHV82_16730 [Victivallaceae bacterium]|nr:hypothetical protein [Victivallaceae bacterium]